LSGTAEIVEPGEKSGPELKLVVKMLRQKYPQYESMDIDRTPMIKITPTRLRSWRGKLA